MKTNKYLKKIIYLEISTSLDRHRLVNRSQK